MKKEPISALHDIARILYDKKGFNILALDVRGICTLTDFFLIAEGNVEPHVIALAKHVMERMKVEGIKATHIEGLSSGDWIVLDYLEIVVHIFKPGLRDRYRLEELWREGKIIDLDFGE